MEIIFNAVIWTNFILFIWFETDVFSDYLGWTKLFKINDYNLYKSKNPRISYPDFLFLDNPNFFTKLLSCKPCLLFWLVFFYNPIYNFEYIPIIYLTSYCLYKILKKYFYG